MVPREVCLDSLIKYIIVVSRMMIGSRSSVFRDSSLVCRTRWFGFGLSCHIECEDGLCILIIGLWSQYITLKVMWSPVFDYNVVVFVYF